MKRAILLLLCSCTFILHAQPKHYTAANAHSHNDYEQPIPFWTAYNNSFGSIEADIFLHNDSLLVAHGVAELSLHRSLEQYYLQPLVDCIKNNNGYVYADKKRKLQLLIDIKTDSINTLNKLIEVMRKYPLLINTHSLIITVSGNRPNQAQFNSYPSFITFDGVLSQNYSFEALKKITLLSDNIANYVYGKEPSNEEWQQLQDVVKKAHMLNKPVRFWGTTDNSDTWKKLIALQVDYINTDHIGALAAFLKKVQ